MLTQLDPPIPVVTPKGKGLAHVLIDYGAEHDLIWMRTASVGLTPTKIFAVKLT
jgi:hypothetical protein